MIKPLTFLAGVVVVLFAAATVLEAKVSPEEAAALQGELTPVGAIRAGNADGTIPAWTGGITELPEGWTRGGAYQNPYPDDQVLFTITAANVQQYADRLTEGQKALFERYPDTWKMKVYPTRRSAAWPQRIYDAIARNAVTAELAPGGNGVLNASEGIPFPIPQQGVETIWNHLLRFRGESIHRVYAQIPVTATGSYTPVIVEEKILLPYARAGATIESIRNISVYFLQSIKSPPRLAGELLLVHDTVDQVKEPRSAWTYNPGQRRVRRAPNVAYDNPGTGSDGLRTSDQLDMYNGAPDRYDWTLVGRKELFVPYNSYPIGAPELKHADIIRPGHLNPELPRYELHRVWVTEARVKEGTRHVYARRTFYFDEDSWSILESNQYDSRDRIWRVSMSHAICFYDRPFTGPLAEAHYDLQNGRFLVVGLTNETRSWDFNLQLKAEDFTPAALRREGRR